MHLEFIPIFSPGNHDSHGQRGLASDGQAILSRVVELLTRAERLTGVRSPTVELPSHVSTRLSRLGGLMKPTT